VQVSRLGNPRERGWSSLGQKDRFNRTKPDQDAVNYGQFVTNPELARILNAQFGISAPETGRATSSWRCSRGCRT
jgi:hypothetical protein